jgi:hypothetical protein
MIGKIFITRSGYDPQLGKHVKDPYLGANPTLGACRPDVRRQLNEGDHIFVISGKVPEANQYVMGGFEIDAKIPALEAYKQFPKLRLRQLEDGQLTGNIIVDSEGAQHSLDDHKGFESRIENYVVGRNLLTLDQPEEILRGRSETLEVLQDIMQKKGSSPVQVVGRWGSRLQEDQIHRLRGWLKTIKGIPN